VELDWLETFLAVVDRGGFTAASAQVHRSQSRVSAHIAGLERELGVQLIDRSHRPATVTTAGRIFAAHARDILADVGSARSAIGVLRAMDEESLAVLTTPSIGAALFPGVLAEVLGRHPGARISLSERGWLDEKRHPGEGFVLAVLPSYMQPHAPGLQEQLLWREQIKVVVPRGHDLDLEFGGSGRAVPPARLAEQELVIGGMFAHAEPLILAMLAARGHEVHPRVTVEAAHTLVAMVRGGLGVGVANAVALENADGSGVVLLDIDDPAMVREVGVYWYDVLLTTEVGRVLHETVLKSPLPQGAVGVPEPGVD